MPSPWRMHSALRRRPATGFQASVSLRTVRTPGGRRPRPAPAIAASRTTVPGVSATARHRPSAGPAYVIAPLRRSERVEHQVDLVARADGERGSPVGSPSRIAAAPRALATIRIPGWRGQSGERRRRVARPGTRSRPRPRPGASRSRTGRSARSRPRAARCQLDQPCRRSPRRPRPRSVGTAAPVAGADSRSPGHRDHRQGRAIARARRASRRARPRSCPSRRARARDRAFANRSRIRPRAASVAGRCARRVGDRRRSRRVLVLSAPRVRRVTRERPRHVADRSASRSAIPGAVGRGAPPRRPRVIGRRERRDEGRPDLRTRRHRAVASSRHTRPARGHSRDEPSGHSARDAPPASFHTARIFGE